MQHREHEDMECYGDDGVHPLEALLYILGAMICSSYVAVASAWRFVPW